MGAGESQGGNNALKYKTILLGDPRNASAHEKLGLIYFKQAMGAEDSDSESSSDDDDTPRSSQTTGSDKDLKLERKLRDKKNLKQQ